MRNNRPQYAGKYVAGYGNSRKIHILMAERVLGRPLPDGAHVHHVNENSMDNTPSNLVICPDAAYHKLLHRRTDALNACGNADWRKCCHCKQYDDPKNLSIRTRRVRGIETPLVYHLACNTANGLAFRGLRKNNRKDWARGPRSKETIDKLRAVTKLRWEKLKKDLGSTA